MRRPIDNRHLLVLQSVNQPDGNTTFVDESLYARAVTPYNPYTDYSVNHSTARAVYAAYSNSGIQVATSTRFAALNFPPSPDWAFSDDFTVETWFYWGSGWQNFATRALVSCRYFSDSPARGWALKHSATGNGGLIFDCYVGGVAYQTPAFLVTAYTWTHIAVVRKNGVITVYRNGTALSTTTADGALSASASGVLGVNYYQYSGQVASGSGRTINHLAISNTARYDENFTPPRSYYYLPESLDSGADFAQYMDQLAILYGGVDVGGQQAASLLMPAGLDINQAQGNSLLMPAGLDINQAQDGSLLSLSGTDQRLQHAASLLSLSGADQRFQNAASLPSLSCLDARLAVLQLNSNLIDTVNPYLSWVYFDTAHGLARLSVGELDTAQALNAYAVATAQLEAAHALIVGAALDSAHGLAGLSAGELDTGHALSMYAAAAAQLEAAYALITGAALDNAHGLARLSVGELDTGHALSMYAAAAAQLEAAHALIVGAALDSAHGLAGLSVGELDTSQALNAYAAASLHIDVAHALITGAALDSAHGLARLSVGELDTQQALLSAATAALESSHALHLGVYPSATLDTWHRMPPAPPAPITLTELFISVAGKRLEISGAVIRADQEAPGWSGSLELVSESEYRALALGTDFVLHTPGEDFALFVGSKTKTRKFGETRYQVNFLSPAARLGPEYHAPITLPDSAGWAADFATSAVGALSWEMVNWQIPAGRLAMENAAPLEVAQYIAQAAGGWIGTTANGGLFARPVYKTPIAQWEQAAPDLVLSDDQDNLSMSEEFSGRERWNSVQITDLELPGRTWSLNAELDEDSKTSGTLRLHSRPWTELVEMTHTGRPTVFLEARPVEIRTLTEEIEFKGGAANTSAPVYQIIGVTWLYADLGQVTAELDNNALTAPGGNGYSIARIQYTTRAMRWRVGNAEPETTQFIAVEI